MKTATPIDSLVATVTACVWQSDGHRQEAISTINEMVSAFGEVCVLDAIFESDVSKKLRQVGGDQLRLARMAIAEICQSRNMGLTADLLALAMGLGERAGMTLTDVGRRHGVTKQAASAALNVLVCRMDLPRVYCQLSERARDAYRTKNRRHI